MLETVLITGGIIAFIIIIDLILSFEQYKKNLLFWKIELKSYKIKIVKTKREM